jgi:hypothetical protein
MGSGYRIRTRIPDPDPNGMRIQPDLDRDPKHAPPRPEDVFLLLQYANIYQTYTRFGLTILTLLHFFYPFPLS